MELVTVVAHEILMALYDVVGVFIFVGVISIAAMWGGRNGR